MGGALLAQVIHHKKPLSRNIWLKKMKKWGRVNNLLMHDKHAIFYILWKCKKTEKIYYSNVNYFSDSKGVINNMKIIPGH